MKERKIEVRDCKRQFEENGGEERMFRGLFNVLIKNRNNYYNFFLLKEIFLIDYCNIRSDLTFANFLNWEHL